MKIKITRLSAVLIAAFILVFILVGCSDAGGGQSSEPSETDVSGTNGYPVAIMYGKTFGSEAFNFVYDEELVKKFVDMVAACEYSDIDQSSSEIPPLIYGEYYDFSHVADGKFTNLLTISKDGKIVIDGGTFYRISGFDITILDEFDVKAKQ